MDFSHALSVRSGKCQSFVNMWDISADCLLAVRLACQPSLSSLEGKRLFLYGDSIAVSGYSLMPPGIWH